MVAASVHTPQSRRGRQSEWAWRIALAGALITAALLTISDPDQFLPAFKYLFSFGFLTTVQLVFASLAGALVLGTIAGTARTSRHPAINIAGSVYIESIRGLPILVLLFMSYYGLNQFLPMGWKLDPFAAAVLCFSLAYGAFIGEAIRAGIEAIPQEEIEAASLDAAPLPRFIHITGPRAFRTIMPAVGNEFIALLKDSSIVMIIALRDLTKAGYEYAGRTFDYFTTYFALALVYRVLTLLLSRFVRWMEGALDS